MHSEEIHLFLRFGLLLINDGVSFWDEGWVNGFQV
jgi:hypothetical protein